MSESKPIVYIVDDDEIVAEQITKALSSKSVEICYFEGGESFLEAIVPTDIAVVLLDMRMPGMDGLEVQEALRAKGCVQPVIFTTAFEDVESAVTAMRHGAMDYLLKPVEESELHDRVEVAIQEARATVRQSQEADLVKQRFERLTPREAEVFALMVQGKANKVMSIELGVSQRTVEIHRARVMEKMEARSLADLFRLSLYLDVKPGL